MFEDPRSKYELSELLEKSELDAVMSRITEKLQLTQKKKTMHDSNLINNCLRNHFIFYNLSQVELENVKEKMFYCEIKAGDMVFSQGDIGHCFFIVEKGHLEILVNDKPKKQLKPQDGFGELALLYNTQRTSSIRATETSNLWVIDRQTFREAVEEIITKEYEENRKCLEGIRFFLNLTNQQKDIIASALVNQKYYKNQTIIQEGDPGSAFYIIKEGSAAVYKGNKFTRKLNKGDSFGEQSLYYNTIRQLTIKAEDEVTCLVLGRDTLSRVLSDKIHEVTFKNFIKWAFQKNPTLSKMSKSQSERVIDAMKIAAFKANDPIFKKAISGCQKIVVVIEGSLKKLKNGGTVASKGQCWGQDFLLEANRTKTLDDEIVMQTDGVLAQIIDTTFFECIGGIRFEEIIKKNEKNQQRKMVIYENHRKKLGEHLQLHDLIFVQEVSPAQFGEVYAVKDRNNNLYALKTLSKAELADFDVQKYIAEEKRVLMQVAFPFIIQIVKTLSDHEMLYYLLEFVEGVDLFEVLKDIGLLSTFDCQFYVANIILILEYLHGSHIMARDVKPENFMVDSKGYLKLVNLSTAKILKPDQASRTNTIISTPHYMAPEIIIGKGYNHLVDLWSLGVCLFQFMCGYLPFGDDADGPYEIYDDIMRNELKFPDFIKDKKAKKLMEQLLNHNPEVRHGGSFATLKSNPWFEGFEWQDLLNRNDKKMEPPYVPDLKSKLIELHGQIARAKLPLLDKIKEYKLNKSISDNLNDSYDWSQF